MGEYDSANTLTLSETATYTSDLIDSLDSVNGIPCGWHYDEDTGKAWILQ